MVFQLERMNTELNYIQDLIELKIKSCFALSIFEIMISITNYYTYFFLSVLYLIFALELLCILEISDLTLKQCRVVKMKNVKLIHNCVPTGIKKNIILPLV